jgi:hypothetical protein
MRQLNRTVASACMAIACVAALTAAQAQEPDAASSGRLVDSDTAIPEPGMASRSGTEEASHGGTITTSSSNESERSRQPTAEPVSSPLGPQQQR